MLSLRSLGKKIEGTFGSAIDRIVPGNQSFLHPQAQAPINRPQVPINRPLQTPGLAPAQQINRDIFNNSSPTSLGRIQGTLAQSGISQKAGFGVNQSNFLQTQSPQVVSPDTLRKDYGDFHSANTANGDFVPGSIKITQGSLQNSPSVLVHEDTHALNALNPGAIIGRDRRIGAQITPQANAYLNNAAKNSEGYSQFFNPQRHADERLAYGSQLAVNPGTPQRIQSQYGLNVKDPGFFTPTAQSLQAINGSLPTSPEDVSFDNRGIVQRPIVNPASELANAVNNKVQNSPLYKTAGRVFQGAEEGLLDTTRLASKVLPNNKNFQAGLDAVLNTTGKASGAGRQNGAPERIGKFIGENVVAAAPGALGERVATNAFNALREGSTISRGAQTAAGIAARSLGGGLGYSAGLGNTTPQEVANNVAGFVGGEVSGKAIPVAAKAVAKLGQRSAQDFALTGGNISSAAARATRNAADRIKVAYKNNPILSDESGFIGQRRAGGKFASGKQIHPEDQATMTDFIDYSRGAYKPRNETEAHQLELDASRVAEHYNIGNGQKTVGGLANAFDKHFQSTPSLLDRIKAPLQNEGGYIRLPGSASDNTVKKIFTKQTDGNSLYHATETDGALNILKSGVIKRFQSDTEPAVSFSRARNQGIQNSPGLGRDVKFVVDNDKITQAVGKTRPHVDGELNRGKEFSMFEAEQRATKKDVPLSAVKRIELHERVSPEEEAQIRQAAQKHNIPVVSTKNANEMRSVLEEPKINTQIGNAEALQNNLIRTNATDMGMTPEQIAETQAAIDRHLANPLDIQNTPAPIEAPGAPRPTVQGKVAKDSAVQDILRKISQGRAAANNEEAIIGSTLQQESKKAGIKLDQDFIDKYQAGNLKTRQEKQLGAAVKDITDKTFARQQQLDPSIQYRENYLPQTYKQDPQSVVDATRNLQQSTGSAKARAFDTYAEARDFGLQPKYDSATPMVGKNASSAIRAQVNREAVQSGIQSGLFNTKAGTPVEGFSHQGEQVYAEKRVADLLNGVTQKDTTGLGKLFSKGAKFNATWQDVALAGGIPWTPWNMFTIGQVGKELTAGRISVARDVVYSMTKNLTQKRFAQNADFIREMGQRGLQITSQNPVSQADKSGLAKLWGDAINEPTFGRYMPNAYLTTAQNTFKRLEGKVGREKALDIAADTAKKFYGVIDDVQKGRTTLSHDAMGTLLFAPRYRESILNTLVNTAKSVAPQNITNPAYRMNQRLLAGLALTMYGYDQVNRQINGHGMFDNRPGQELSIQIPYGSKDAKGNQPVINIPFMPGFFTIPRAGFNAVKGVLDGNTGNAVRGVASTLSMPLQTAGNILANQDYFGRPIYNNQKTADENGINPDSAGTAAKKIGSYLAGQSAPSPIRAVIDAANGKPAAQNLAQAAEVPIRFGKVTNPATTAYFDSLDSVQKGLNKNDKATFQSLHPSSKNINGEDIKDTNPNDRIAKATTLRANPTVFKAESDLQKNLRDKTGQKIDPLYELGDQNKVNAVLWARSLAPGESSDTKQELLYNQPWYKDFANKEDAYYASLEKKFGKKDDPYNYPQKTPQINNLQDAYYKLPKGTGDRSAFITANPALTKYWDDQSAATNRHRLALGLPPIEDDSPSSGSSSGSKGYSRSGGSGSSYNPAADTYKYAVSLNAGGSPVKVSVQAKTTAKIGKAKAAGKPKVTLKKSRV